MATVLIGWWIGSALVGVVVYRSLSGAPRARDLQLLLAVGSIALLAYGAWRGEQDVATRQGQLREMVEGIARTYAYGLAREGHGRIGLDTSPDDPTHLALIEMQREWLAVNPTVADVHTFRRLPDGQIALIVDSETDYDHNGTIEGDRESRTEIGEIYDSVEPELVAALDGRASFMSTPSTDRWGTRVSAFVPMLDEQGQIEAVCGVDHEASDWIAAVHQARVAVYTRCSVLQLLFFSGLIWMARSRSDIARRERTETELRAAVEDARAGRGDRIEDLVARCREAFAAADAALARSVETTA